MGIYYIPCEYKFKISHDKVSLVGPTDIGELNGKELETSVKETMLLVEALSFDSLPLHLNSPNNLAYPFIKRRLEGKSCLPLLGQEYEISIQSTRQWWSGSVKLSRNAINLA